MSAKVRASASITCASRHEANSTNVSVQHYCREETTILECTQRKPSSFDAKRCPAQFHRRSPQYGTVSDQQRVLPQHHGTGDAFGSRCWRSVLAMIGSDSRGSARLIVRMHSGTFQQTVSQLYRRSFQIRPSEFCVTSVNASGTDSLIRHPATTSGRETTPDW